MAHFFKKITNGDLAFVISLEVIIKVYVFHAFRL